MSAETVKIVDHLVDRRMRKEFQSPFPPAGSDFAEEVNRMLRNYHRNDIESSLSQPESPRRSRIRHI